MGNHAVFKQKNNSQIDWDTVPLGDRSDREIATDLGISRDRVRAARRKRNIAGTTFRYIFREGQATNSMQEAMFDAYLHSRNILHIHQAQYPGTLYRCDFQIDGTFVEVLGMIEIPEYAQRHHEKMNALSSLGFKVVTVRISEVKALFHNCGLALIERPGRQCNDCSKPTVDLVEGFCNPCYMKRWHKEHAEERVCSQCGRPYRGAPSQKFCSYECYWRSIEFSWPPWSEIDERLKTESVSEVARSLGFRPTALHQRLHRRRMRAGVSTNENSGEGRYQ